MHARRLIAVPVAALAAVLLVGAVIDAGARSRETRAAADTAAAQIDDPAVAVEARRVREALAAADRCTGPADCTTSGAAARVRHAADAVAGWSWDQRFTNVRTTLRAQLLAQAALLEQRRVLEARSDEPTTADRARLEELEQRLDHAARATTIAQRSAGLIDRVAYDEAMARLS